jgi:hypothetical protein
MGYGESYAIELSEWLEALTQEERARYREMFPEPKTWSGWYSDDDDDTDSAEYHYLHGTELWNPGGAAKYTRDWLVSQKDRRDFVYFWMAGSKPEECFSQWHYSEFEEDHWDFSCAEQYMMAYKAMVFEDDETRDLILKSSDPREMKLLGRRVKGFDEEIWRSVRHSVVLNGNYRKFSQNKDMRGVLLNTGDKILVEASPTDTIWGIGYSDSNPNAAIPENWRGENLLGFALMEVRDELRRVYADS